MLLNTFREAVGIYNKLKKAGVMGLKPLPMNVMVSAKELGDYKGANVVDSKKSFKLPASSPQKTQGKLQKRPLTQQQPQRQRVKPSTQHHLINLPTPDDTEYSYRVPWSEFKFKGNAFYVTQHNELVAELELIVREMKAIDMYIKNDETKLNQVMLQTSRSSSLNVTPQVYMLKKQLMESKDLYDFLEGKRLRILSQMMQMQDVYLKKISNSSSQHEPANSAINPPLSKEDQQLLQQQREAILKATEETELLVQNQAMEERRLSKAQDLLRQLQNNRRRSKPAAVHTIVNKIADIQTEINETEAHYEAIEMKLDFSLKNVKSKVLDMNNLTQRLLQERSRRMLDTSRIPTRKASKARQMNRSVIADEGTVKLRVFDLEKNQKKLMENIAASRERIDDFRAQMNETNNSTQVSFGFIEEEIKSELDLVKEDSESLEIIDRELMRFCDMVFFNSFNYSRGLVNYMRNVYKGLARRGYKPSRLPRRRLSKKIVSSPRKMVIACELKIILNLHS